MNLVDPRLVGINNMRRLLLAIDCTRYSHDNVATIYEILDLLDDVAHGYCAGSLCRSCVNTPENFVSCIPPLVVMGGKNPCVEAP